MLKNIQDYLFMLIGQIVVFEQCDYHLVHDKHIHKKEKHILEGWMVDYITKKKGKVIVKPLLRKLSDMTEAEENEVARICFGTEEFVITYRGMGYYRNGHQIHQTVKCLKLEQYCDHPLIKDTVDAAVVQIDYTDLLLPIIIGKFTKNGKVLENDMIQENFELTRYLAKQGFDIYGLIEAGLAYDKNSVKFLLVDGEVKIFDKMQKAYNDTNTAGFNFPKNALTKKLMLLFNIQQTYDEIKKGNPVHFTEVNKGAGGTVYRIVEGLKEYFDMDAVAEVVGDKPNALSSFGHMQDFFFKSFTKPTDCTNYIIKLK